MKKIQKRRWVIDDILIKFERYKILKKIIKFFFYNYYVFLYKKKLRKNKELKNTIVGQKCLVLGTGLSIYETKIKDLKNFKIFACNEIFLHADFFETSIDFYVVAEPMYPKILGKKYIEDFTKLFVEISNFFKNKNTFHFYNVTVFPLIKKIKNFKHLNTYFFLSKKSHKSNSTLNNNLSSSEFSFGDGALPFMISNAIYMGATEIYILGAGYTFDPPLELHFYDSPNLKKSSKPDEITKYINEFQKSYPNLDFSESFEAYNHKWFYAKNKNKKTNSDLYNKINNFVLEKKVKIFNVIPEGFTSPFFPSITINKFNSLFLGNKSKN